MADLVLRQSRAVADLELRIGDTLLTTLKIYSKRSQKLKIKTPNEKRAGVSVHPNEKGGIAAALLLQHRQRRSSVVFGCFLA